MTTAPKGKRRRSEKKDSNWPYIVPIVILALLAFASYAWRQQQNAQSAAQSQALRLTVAANQQATEAAIALIPTATPTPTRTPLPTATSVPTEAPTALPAATEAAPPTATTALPTATPEPLPTATATATAQPSPTPTDEPIAANVTVRQSQSSLRRGPSRGYNTLTLAEAGQTLVATGRSADDAWIFVCCIDDASGWIAVELLDTDLPFAQLPFVDAPSVLARPDGQGVPLYAGPSYGELTGERVAVGDVLEVTGRTSGSVWLRVCCGDGGGSGWLPNLTVAIDGVVETVDVVESE